MLIEVRFHSVGVRAASACQVLPSAFWWLRADVRRGVARTEYEGAHVQDLHEPPGEERAGSELDGGAEAWHLLELVERELSLQQPSMKRKGVVYTPRRLAEAVALMSLNMLADPAPRRVLDPSCGSGHLLLAVMVILKGRGLSGLSLLERAHGVDRDPFAVALCRLVVALQCDLEACSSREAFELSSRLCRQIRVGDGLAADASRYDLLVANPPYQRASRHDGAELRARFSTARGAFDLFVPFVEHSLSLLSPNGLAVFIVSNKLLLADYGRALRALLRDRGDVRVLLDLTCDRPFEALVDPVVLAVGSAKHPRARLVVAHASGRIESLTQGVRSLLALESGGQIEGERLSAEGFGAWPWAEVEQGDAWPSRCLGETRRRVERMQEGSIALGSCFEVRTGVMGFDYRAVLEVVEEWAGHGDHRLRVITNAHIRAHEMRWGEHRVKLGGREYDHPVLACRPQVLSESIWSWFSQPKVIIGGIAKRVHAALDLEGRCAPLVAVHGIRASRKACLALSALLNSRVITWYYLTWYAGAQIPQGSHRISVGMLRRLPLPSCYREVEGTLAELSEGLLEQPGNGALREALLSELEAVVASAYGLANESRSSDRWSHR